LSHRHRAGIQTVVRGIDAVAAIESVVAGAAVEGVVAAKALEGIVAAEARDDFGRVSFLGCI